MASKEVNIDVKNMHLENLKCLLCVDGDDTLKNPKTLSCGHTFCSDCIGDSNENTENVMCELCGEHTDRHAIESAEYANILLEVIKKIEAADNAHCFTCEATVTLYCCEDCEKFYCDECLSVHDRIPTTANHQSYSLEGFFSINQFDTVKEHCECEERDCVRVRCITCDFSPMCMKCAVDELHKSHEFVEIDLFTEISDFKCISECSQDRFNDLKKVYEDIDGVTAGLEVNRNSCLEIVSEYEKSLEVAVKERIQTYKDEVQTKYREKIEFSAIQKKNLLTMKNNLFKSSKVMMDIIEFENPALVVSTGRKLINSIESQNYDVTDLEPNINQHMSVLNNDNEIFSEIQAVPDIVYMNGAFGSNCTISVNTDVVTCGHVASMCLLTYDIDGNAVTVGGADVTAVFRHHTGDHEVEADITDNNDGSYDITASCDIPGQFSIYTFVFDKPVPYIPVITAIQWVVPEKEFSVYRGQKFKVVVQPTDDFGEVVKNTLEDITADLISPTGDVTKCDVYYSADKCEVKPAAYLESAGHWTIIFRDPSDVATVDVHVFEWNFESTNVFKQLNQHVEIHLSASPMTPDVKPNKKPKILINLVNPEGNAKSIMAAKVEDFILYRVSFKCDMLGQWNIKASVFGCALPDVNINIIEWVVDAAPLVTRGEEFKFKVLARDVDGNSIEEASHVVTAQATTTRPTGGLVDLQIESTDDGLYIIGRLNVLGIWSLKVCVDGEQLIPVSIKTVDWKLEPDHVVLSIGETFNASLKAIDDNQEVVSEARANIHAFLDTVTGRHTFDVLDNADGSYSITGQCFEIGIWKLQIQVDDDVKMLDVQVVNWTLDVTSAILSTNQTFSITLTAIDENGERVPCGRGDIIPYLQNPKQMFRKTELTELNNGSYEISGKCNISGVWVLGVRVNGEPPCDFEVPIDVVKEGHVMSVETRDLWLNKTSSEIACLTWYTEDLLLACNKTNQILMITKTGGFVTGLSIHHNRQISYIHPCYNGKIVLLDKAKSEVLILPQFGLDATISFGSSTLTSPTSLAVNSSADNIFVVDSAKCCVLKFNFTGELLNYIGLEKNKPGHLIRPWSVAVNKEDELLISDNGNNLIQMYSNEGKFLKTFVRSGREDGLVVLPRDIMIGPNGDVLIASDHRVQLFDENGRFMRTIVQDGIMNPRHITIVSRVPRQIACVPSDGSIFHLYYY